MPVLISQGIKVSRSESPQRIDNRIRYNSFSQNIYSMDQNLTHELKRTGTINIIRSNIQLVNRGETRHTVEKLAAEISKVVGREDLFSRANHVVRQPGDRKQ